MRDPQKILVIQQKMIGDVLAGTVICSALREWFPKAEIHYMIQPHTKAVVEGNPEIDKIVLFDPEKSKGFSGLMEFGKKLRREKYDAVIDAYGKWESVIPAWKSNATVRIGFEKWYTKFFFTRTVTPKANVSGSAIAHRLQLAQELTGKPSHVAFPEIHLSEQERKTALENLQSAGLNSQKILMISVLGSGKSKSLPNHYMAGLLDEIARVSEAKMLFNFIPQQQSEAREIYELCLPETREKIVFDFYMKGLRPFLAVLSYCDALIGNEGGAVNMAKALDIPTFTIFSPWINKDSWNMLAGDDHVAVHLNDFEPEIYGGKHPKKFKDVSAQLYEKLKPELFSDQLQNFARRVTS